MQVLETPEKMSWRKRVLAWKIGQTAPVAIESASAVRSEISICKKRFNKNLRFKTWSDTVDGKDVVMVERLPDAEA
ncbi:hypothetical protein BWD42_04270 [Sphingobacterium sp. CZ-UAM]|uniref:hypothetical protein n=1 Tax=Sphingobacterium sp. CZ-UAM TaxID=1933868 RepID=UPI0009879507|nr:hypothetical protein [Sphingobacterium sp. CZ-UAM]OOG19170.1 hypothetical protein BWD42_04270 [Sphingobacterium sp. CZ-UAM]